jgi:3-deoxy-D-manno-octulosonic-acid transferase
MQRVLDYFDLALMQGQKDANRLVNLGIRSPKVKITGNIKFDQAIGDAESDLTKEFRQRFAVSKDAPLIVAASTHAPEESLILDAFKLVYKSAATQKLPRLLIAPRHPERFAEVAQLIKSTGFDWVRRGEEPSPRDKNAEIILLDSIGELRAIYSLAEIVFVGGSLIAHGGQNILEPASAQKAIVSGFYTMNFEAIVKEFLSQNALIQLPKLAPKDVSAKLAETFLELVNDPERRDKLAANAFRVLQINRGATGKTIEHLKILMQPK